MHWGRHGVAIAGDGGVVEHGEEGGGADEGGELLLGVDEVGLNLVEAVLEDGDEADAAVDRVSEAELGLVRQRVHRVLPLGHVEVAEDLGHVAGPEHLVDVGELLRLVRREVRGVHALQRALPPEKLARRAR